MVNLLFSEFNFCYAFLIEKMLLFWINKSQVLAIKQKQS